MALVDELITAQSRQDLRTAILEKGAELASQLGLTCTEGNMIGTQMVQVLTSTEVEEMPF